MKYQASLALRKNSSFSGEEKTVSKTKSRPFSRQSYRKRVASSAAFRTASGEFQSPKVSCAMLSGLMYMLSAAHSLLSSWTVVVVFPEPFGPATMQRVGFLSFIMIPDFSTLLFHLLQSEVFSASQLQPWHSTHELPGQRLPSVPAAFRLWALP